MSQPTTSRERHPFFITVTKFLSTQDDVYAYGAEHLFTVRGIHGAIVALESVQFPTHFVSANGKNGTLILERQELKAYCVQFTVYVSVSDTPSANSA